MMAGWVWAISAALQGVVRASLSALIRNLTRCGSQEIAAHLRYMLLMKTAAIPSVRVEPGFRVEVEAVLADGETLSDFVEASVRASVERRRVQAEFVVRGLRSRDEARRTGGYADADSVLEGLQRKLDAARDRLATKVKCHPRFG